MRGEPRSGKIVIAEIRRRAKAGRSLASGSNRGDWLYASAVKYLGSWHEAVEAAGFRYEDHHERLPLTKSQIIAQLKAIAGQDEKVLASEHSRLALNANRQFGSWKAALEASGVPESGLKWTPAKVVAGIRDRARRGLKTNSVTMMREDKNLYMAGRRRFGTWAAALEAAGQGVTKKAVQVTSARRRKATRR